PKDIPLPELQRNELEDAFDEIELLGFPLCDPFKLIEYPVHETCSASDLRSRLGKSVRAIGYCVTTKDTSTITGALMHFGTFYDYNGEVFDSVHFPDVAARYPF